MSVKVYHCAVEHENYDSPYSVSIAGKEMFDSKEVVLKSDYDKLESENRILKAKLEKCKEQRDYILNHGRKFGVIAVVQDSALDKELDSIEQIGERMVNIWWAVYYDYNRNQLVQVVKQIECCLYTYYYDDEPIVSDVRPKNFGLIFIGFF